jgi:hypothetical protein
MAITTSTPLELQHIIHDLSTTFEIVHLGELKWMLGIEISRDHAACTISLCQSTYVDKITHCFGFENATSAHIPLDPYTTLTALQSPSTEVEVLSMAHVPYHALLGSIMYAAVSSQPDIAFTIGKLSHHCVNPGEAHWTAAKQVLCYLFTHTLFI